MGVVIWWIRRDLRLTDNAALKTALLSGQTVLPLFILDPELLRKPAGKRQAFLWAGLRALEEDLRSRGSRLLVRRGEAVGVLQEVLQASGAERIYAEEDYSPYSRRRDAQVSERLPVQWVLGATVHHPEAVHKPDGKPYTVFTPFSKAWKALPLAREGLFLPPAHLAAPPELPGDPLPEGEACPPDFPAGEAEALRRLRAFLSGPAAAYAEDRNRMDLDGTSTLSPYLRFGMLSARQAVLETLAAQKDPAAARGCEVFLNELIWREFYNAILYHFPQVLRTAFNPALRAIPWRDAPEDLRAWQEGRTGYPVVDAAMRQLAHTGWMHNRARMIVASFLVKDLLINWQEGERWFMQGLVDGDPAANNGGWQWTAGVGTDAAPYFRVFNPVLQGQKFDPLGRYVRRWLPELAGVPDEFIHDPWRMPLDIQQRCGCRIGVEYPAPIVDHAVVKERTLAAYGLSKGMAASL